MALVIKSAIFPVTVVIRDHSSLMQIQRKTFHCNASEDVLQIASVVRGWDREE